MSLNAIVKTWASKFQTNFSLNLTRAFDFRLVSYHTQNFEYQMH